MLRDELTSLAHSFRCAGAGVATAFVSQRSFRLQASAAAVVVVSGLLLQVTLLEWAVLALTMSMVLAAEVFNSALEVAVDLACPAWCDQVRLAKDLAAGATLIAALGSVAVGTIVFTPRLLSALGL